MSPEERNLLESLFERIRSEALAPRDAQAEKFIADAILAQPHASYVMAQAVIVQDQALQSANRRLQELEILSRTAKSSEPADSFLNRISKTWLGSSATASSPQAPPYLTLQGPQPPMAPNVPVATGGGFLQNALGAATGAAGGVLLAESVRGLFSGHAPRWTGEGVPSVSADVMRAQDLAQDKVRDQDEVQSASADDSFDSSWFA